MRWQALLRTATEPVPTSGKAGGAFHRWVCILTQVGTTGVVEVALRAVMRAVDPEEIEAQNDARITIHQEMYERAEVQNMVKLARGGVFRNDPTLFQSKKRCWNPDPELQLSWRPLAIYFEWLFPPYTGELVLDTKSLDTLTWDEERQLWWGCEPCPNSVRAFVCCRSPV